MNYTTYYFYKVQKLLVLILLPLSLGSCITIPGMPAFDSKLTPKDQQAIPERDFRLIKLNTKNIVYFSHHKKKKRAFFTPGKAHGTGGYRYYVGSQDILNVTVWGSPTLTAEGGDAKSSILEGHNVNADGYFFFPYAGRIYARGRTTEQIRLELQRKLKKYLTDPQVIVSILAYRSQRVHISGAVIKPNVFKIDDTPLTIRDIIAKAGGLKSFVKGKDKDLETSRRALLTRSNKNKIMIDLKALFNKGDRSQNYVLRGGDTVHIIERDDDSKKEDKVFVMGEVKKAGTLILDEFGISLAEALSNSGGINEDKANPSGIFVMRNIRRKGRYIPTVYQLKLRSVHSMLLAEKFALRDRDIIYVTAAPLSRWNRVISQILPSLSAATSIDNLAK